MSRFPHAVLALVVMRCAPCRRLVARDRSRRDAYRGIRGTAGGRARLRAQRSFALGWRRVSATHRGRLGDTASALIQCRASVSMAQLRVRSPALPLPFPSCPSQPLTLLYLSFYIHSFGAACDSFRPSTIPSPSGPDTDHAFTNRFDRRHDALAQFWYDLSAHLLVLVQRKYGAFLFGFWLRLCHWAPFFDCAITVFGGERFDTDGVGVCRARWGRFAAHDTAMRSSVPPARPGDRDAHSGPGYALFPRASACSPPPRLCSRARACLRPRIAC
jgi:hypothetical protein